MCQPAIPSLAHELALFRSLRDEDIRPWQAYLMQPVVHEHTSWDARNPEQLQRHLRATLAQLQPPTSTSPIRFAVARRASDALLGTAGFHSVCRDSASAEIAYDLDSDCWAHGIGTSVCVSLVHWAFERFDWDHIRATVMPSNERSIRVLEKSGFRRVGLLLRHRVVRGTPSDFLLYVKGRRSP